MHLARNPTKPRVIAERLGVRMGKAKKPNFTPFGNKKSGKKKGLIETLLTPSKKHTSKSHGTSTRAGGQRSGK